MQYKLEMDGNKVRYDLGDFYSQRFLRDIIIAIYEHPEGETAQADFSYADGNFLVTGAVSYEEAMEKLKKYVPEIRD